MPSSGEAALGGRGVRPSMNCASAAAALLFELFAEGSELLLDVGEFAAQAGDFFFQAGEAIGG